MKETVVYSLLGRNFLDTYENIFFMCMCSHFQPANQNAHLTMHNQSKFMWRHNPVYYHTLIKTRFLTNERACTILITLKALLWPTHYEHWLACPLTLLLGHLNSLMGYHSVRTKKKTEIGAHNPAFKILEIVQSEILILLPCLKKKN